MAEHSVFTKRHSEAMAQDRRAILEEMNLPPAVVEFVRANGKAIQTAILLGVLAIVAWEGYGKFIEVRRERSAEMLYQAMKAAPEQRQGQLQELASKYGTNGSGLWGAVEQGHQAFKDGKFQEAVAQYEAVLGKLSPTSPLAPLVRYNVAQAYENLPDLAKAKAAYQGLASVPGFVGEANLGLARIAEHEGKAEEAKAKYQAYVDLPETKDGPTKEWAQSKLKALTPAQGR